MSNNPFNIDEIGVAGGAIPSRYMRITSPRREAGMCANGWVAIDERNTIYGHVFLIFLAPLYASI